PKSADLSAGAMERLRTVLPLLSELKSGVVDIEGYSESGELDHGSEYTSYLELSSIRAVGVAEWLIGNGVRESQVRTSSFGQGHGQASESKESMSGRRV